MRKRHNPTETKSFDLLWKWMEITTGAQREHRHTILVKQANEKGVGLESIQFYLDFFKLAVRLMEALDLASPIAGCHAKSEEHSGCCFSPSRSKPLDTIRKFYEQKSGNPVNEKLVKEIASLARLDLSQEETEMFVSQFKDILDYVSILNEVDTENVPPAYLSSANRSVTREDEIEESVSHG
jgi:aspartyl/glutamyl-tRNA(Asn/Gln) amidotransferase C subunit